MFAVPWSSSQPGLICPTLHLSDWPQHSYYWRDFSTTSWRDLSTSQWLDFSTNCDPCDTFVYFDDPGFYFLHVTTVWIDTTLHLSFFPFVVHSGCVCVSGWVWCVGVVVVVCNLFYSPLCVLYNVFGPMTDWPTTEYHDATQSLLQHTFHTHDSDSDHVLQLLTSLLQCFKDSSDKLWLNICEIGCFPV